MLVVVLPEYVVPRLQGLSCEQEMLFEKLRWILISFSALRWIWRGYAPLP